MGHGANSLARYTALLEEACGCRVESTHDSQTFLRKYRDHLYDLIFIDTHFDGELALKMVKMIREWEFLLEEKPVPIIGIYPEAISSQKLSYQKYYCSGIDEIVLAPLTVEKADKILKTYIFSSPFFKREVGGI